MSIKQYLIPEGYITSDLVNQTRYKSIKMAYEKNNLSVITRGSFWYVEICPDRLYRTVRREMNRLYPNLLPLDEK